MKEKSASFCARIISGAFSRFSSANFGKLRAAAAVGRGRQHRLPVRPDRLDARAFHRQPGADRLHEHVARAVLRLLDDEAEIGDQDQPRILRCRRPGLSSWLRPRRHRRIVRRPSLGVSAITERMRSRNSPRVPLRLASADTAPRSMLS